MSVSFELSQSSPTVRICLSDDAMASISEALLSLQKRTGVYVDPYSHSRLSPTHSELLAQLILSQELSPSGGEINTLLDLLQKSAKEGSWIYVVGD